MTSQEIKIKISLCQEQLNTYQNRLSKINKELKNIEYDIEIFEKMLKKFMNTVDYERYKASKVNQGLGIRFVSSYRDSMQKYLYECEDDFETQRKIIKRKISEYESEILKLNNSLI